MRFTLVDQGATNSIILPSARAALESRPARQAVAGAELRDDAGAILAVKERVDVEDGWLLMWRLTSAWSEARPIVDLEIDVGAPADDDGHPEPAAE